MKHLVKATLSAVAVLALPVFSFSMDSAGKSIYGDDNRLDYYEASSAIQSLSNSVVSLWKSYKVVENTSTGKYDLTTKTMGAAMGLCPDEKFREQNMGAFCSGSLVGKDLVMTAGHCVKSEAACADTKIVFGFKVAKAGEAGPSSVAKSEVYSCSKIVKRFLSGEAGTPNPDGQTVGADYALIKLDREVARHKPLLVNRTGEISKDTKLFVIGHPSGMPLKVAGDAAVRDAGTIGYFVADLDTFGGNSGSAVFNLDTKKIEGILVRGDNDYIPTPAGCTTVATFAQTGGRGEDVTKISALVADVPQLNMWQTIRHYIPLLAGEVEDEVRMMLGNKDAPAEVRDVNPGPVTVEPLPVKVNFR
ncbi:MAG: hypothetical protein A2234_04400 [Elusimicrobia bacterium RIFOXYA2_FULL_58_8]|nr:MAG: hypothetical protein A2285_08250 [Elusimicrobia bacterium RIFOXYA12_FULL_57_11]OGS16986.1 MAG: hypothetical protein A2234_04400 [Elusimicrobia bacterium RIFOXYA2_FULL_58_8]